MDHCYLIGNAHIDPVWLWRKGEGMAEVLSTYRSALDRMKEFPDYVFTSACAYYYQYVSETDPDMMAEIRARVQEGRWRIAGGMWVQPDMNIPGAEAFARHMLYSQRAFARLTGRMARTGYCVDSFGHNGMLPQLLSQGRMENYIFMRPGAHENGRLQDLFRWRAPDGSEVLAYRIPCHYGDTRVGGDDPALEGIDSLTGRKVAWLKAHASGPQMVFYGVGNHGGGPTIRELGAIEGLRDKDTDYAGPDDLFDDVRAAGRADALPLWTHDLQHHASGCYSANVRIKGLCRQAEGALTEAERWAALAGWDVRERMQRAWEKVLFNQFHDILAGCTIRSAARDAMLALAAAIDEAGDVTMIALQKLARRICTVPARAKDACLPPQKNGWLRWEAEPRPGMLSDLPSGVGAPVILFNPHSFPLLGPVKLSAEGGAVRDEQGRALPVQRVRGEQTNGQDKYVTLVEAGAIPPLGHRVLWLYGDAAPAPAPEDPVRVEETPDALIMENAALRVEIDRQAGTVTLTDRGSGRVCLRGGAQALFIDDSACDTWAHGVFTFDREAGRFRAERVEWLEQGALRAQVRAVFTLGHSRLTLTFTLDAGARCLACRSRLLLADELRLVKLCFPTGLADAKAYASMPGGFIGKAINGVEQPCHRWAALSGEENGLTVINDGRYGVSFDQGELRLAIARSAYFADHYGQRDGYMEPMDFGETECRFALMPGFAPEQADQVAEALCTPVRTLLEGQHAGSVAAERQGIAIECDHVRLLALKQAENGSGLILRLMETAGRPARAQVRLGGFPAFTAELPPMGIRTWLLTQEGASLTDFVEPD